MNSFDPASYWEERLKNNPGLLGVGHTRLGTHYNEWLYKVRTRAFSRALRSVRTDLVTANVLDIGSGTGFYIRLWKAAGAARVVGSDLTETAVSRLQRAFPSEEFLKLDIGGPASILGSRTFDVISAFDILFHIVDDQRFEQALKNIFSLLGPGGWFVFSDNFPHGATQRAVHQVSRSLKDVEGLLNAVGFSIHRRMPMFVLMNQPLDTTSRLHSFAWRAFTYPVRKSEAVGYLVGSMLYPVELLLTAALRESPTTEIMICQKPF